MDFLDLFWNIRQQQQIDEATAKAAHAASDARAHEASVADLNSRFDRLVLVTQALSELLSERANVSHDELLAKINEIERRERARVASADRRVCPSCGHEIGGNRTTCLYCGAVVGARKAFDGI